MIEKMRTQMTGSSNNLKKQVESKKSPENSIKIEKWKLLK